MSAGLFRGTPRMPVLFGTCPDRTLVLIHTEGYAGGGNFLPSWAMDQPSLQPVTFRVAERQGK